MSWGRIIPPRPERVNENSIALLTFAAAVMLTLLSSCSVLSPAKFDVSDMSVEKEKNGYLVRISVNKRISDVAAFISKDNWLVVTLVGATVDFDRLRSWEPDDLISNVEVIGYKTSVQLTLKLKQSFHSCEVVHMKQGDNIDISLFAQ